MKLNFTHCYIDPGIKNLDKNFYQFLFTLIQKYQMVTVSEPKDIEEDYPSLFFCRAIDKSKIDDELGIQVLIDQSNLDLFSNSKDFNEGEISGNYFTVTDQEELACLMSLIANDLFLKQQDYIHKQIKKIENSKTYKEVIKQRNGFFKDKKNDVEKFYFELFGNGSFDTNIAINMFKESERFFQVGFLENVEKTTSQNIVSNLPVFFQGDYLGNLSSTDQKGLHFIYSLVSLLNFFHEFKESEQGELNLWKDIFEKVNFPIAIFTDHEDLFLSNKKFSQLNIQDRDIIGIESNELLEIRGQYFRVRVDNQHAGYKVLLFLPADKMLQENESPSLEELGIVSSSVAHELNNPLGAIMASIDVLLLEDDLQLEVKERLEEMKKVVIRCKKLVATFLGFSKSQSNLEILHGEKFDVEDSIQQAIELIRFRLIESNLYMDIKTEKKSIYGHPFNPHVLSMIFYLTFGDIATNFSHKNLINESKGQSTSLLIQEGKDSITVRGGEDLFLSEEILSSKLYLHLLELEGLILSNSGGDLEFKYI